MLQLIEESTGKSLEFEGPFSVRMYSPLFESEQATYSFPVKVPNTINNRAVLGKLDLPEHAENTFIPKKYFVKTSAFALYGTISLNAVDSDYFEFYFVGTGYFFADAENLNLRDMSFDGIDAAYLPTYNANFMDDFPYNAKSESDIGPIYTSVINNLHSSTDISAPGDISLQIAPKIPYLNLNFLFKTIFKNLGFTLTRSPFKTVPELEKLYLVNNNSNTEYAIEELVSFSDIACTITVDSDEGKFKVTTASYIIKADGDYFKLKSITPDIGLSNKIYRIEVIDDHNFYLDGIAPSDFADFTSLSGYVRKMRLVRSLGEENPAEHVPDISAKEFLEHLGNLIAGRVIPGESSNEARFLLFKNILTDPLNENITKYAGPVRNDSFNEYDGYTLSFDSPANDSYWGEAQQEIGSTLTLKDPVETYGSLPISGSKNNDVRYVTQDRAYYRFRKFTFASGEGWDFYSWDFHPHTADGGGLQISTGFAPMLPYKHSDQIWPRADRKGGIISLNNTNYEDLRLVFYRGVFHKDNIFPQYAHLATPDVYDHQGNKITDANLSLRWDGDYGLYKNFHKEYIYWMLNTRKDFVSQIDWPARMLHNFPWERKFKIQYTNYLVKSISFTVSGDNVEFGDTELARV